MRRKFWRAPRRVKPIGPHDADHVSVSDTANAIAATGVLWLQRLVRCGVKPEAPPFSIPPELDACVFWLAGSSQLMLIALDLGRETLARADRLASLAAQYSAPASADEIGPVTVAIEDRLFALRESRDGSPPGVHSLTVALERCRACREWSVRVIEHISQCRVCGAGGHHDKR